MSADDRLIVALDFPDLEQAKNLVLELGDSVSHYKVGMELYYACGNDILKFLKQQNKQVFLDLKLQDIPNTVAGALSVLTKLGVDMLNVHAIGGRKMMEEAAKAVKEAATSSGLKKPKLIAVTILTSMDDVQFADLNYKNSIEKQVVALAKLTKEAGLDGVVASPREVLAIKNACGEDFLVITPGVRPSGSSTNDQSRIATPASAIKDGANYLVVGRPITKAENKIVAAQEIVTEIRGV